MIRSIRLLNWRSHEDSLLEFSEGTNLLVGMMGSGKSSILDGISFALFGTFPAIERRKMKLEDVVRLNESESKIVLALEWNNAAYNIERSVSRSKKGTNTSASLFRNGQMLETGTTPVTGYVENLLSIDYDLFTRAIYAEQNNIDYFLNIDPRRRKQEMDALLGLDRFEQARTNIVSVINRIRSNRKVIEERFSQDRLSEIGRKHADISSERAAITSKLEEQCAMLDNARAVLEENRDAFNKLAQDKENFDRLSKEHVRLSGSADSLKKELAGKEVCHVEGQQLELETTTSKRKSVLEESRKLEHEYSALSRQAGLYESRLRSLEENAKRIEELKTMLGKQSEGGTAHDLAIQAESIEKEILSMNAEGRSLQSQVKEIEETVTTLKPGAAECPVCGSKLTEGHLSGILSEKNIIIKQNKERIRFLLDAIPKKKDEWNRILARIKSIESLLQKMEIVSKDQENIPALRVQNKTLDQELATLSEKRDTLHKSAEILSKEIETLSLSLKEAEFILKKKQELSAVEEKLGSLMASINSMKFSESAFETSRKKLEDSRISCERMLSETNMLKKDLASKNDMLAMVAKELETLRDAESKIASGIKLEEELSIFKNALLDTQTSLRATLADAINSAMNEVWSIFYPYRNYPRIRLLAGEKDYLFQVYDRNEWKNLESIASGGERASAALTLRVALAMVLTPTLSWMMLDEPTHNLDKEAVELLSETLQLKVPEVVKQTFVITHDESLMGSDFASSYRLKRDKSRNGPTEAEKV